MTGDFFSSYYKKIVKEAILKSFLWSLIIGFSFLLVSTGLSWFFGWKHIWICAIIFVIVTVTSTYLFYELKYKPDKKYVAKRIDELGLEERMLTMTELEGDNSFIAVKQREDTIATLATINASFLTYAISVSLIVMVSISGFFGVGMTVVSALSATGTVPSGSVLLPGSSEEDVPQEYVIVYQVEGAGQVLPMSDESGIEQTVSEGLDAEPVMAVADEGWIFVSWSDGRKDPYRQEFAVYENKTLIAIFEEAELGEDLDEKDGEDEGKDSDNKPPNGQGGSQSNSNKPGNQNGGGSRYEPANQVIDGKTYYGGAVYEEAYDKALEEVNQDAELSDEEKDAIGGYFENIKK